MDLRAFSCLSISSVCVQTTVPFEIRKRFFLSMNIQFSGLIYILICFIHKHDFTFYFIE